MNRTQTLDDPHLFTAPRASRPETPGRGRATVAEVVGEALGRVLAPLIASVSRARGARAFHPDGVVYRGRVEVLESVPFPGLGERLAGRVLVRLSGALLRKSENEAPDALGIAVRFRERGGADTDVVASDQDLLFATIRHVITAPLANVTTDQHDYLRNTYWALAPFEVAGIGRIVLRLVPMAAPRASDGDRDEKLERVVTSGRARFRLEARRVHTTTYVPIAIVHLERRVVIDQQTLAFSPFQTGRGFEPRGFLHALRRAVYPASQRARLTGSGRTRPRYRPERG